MGLAEEKPEEAVSKLPSEAEQLNVPVSGKRIPFVWSILAATGLWVLIGAAAYLLYLSV
jgi:hypothetical protein